MSHYAKQRSMSSSTPKVGTLASTYEEMSAKFATRGLDIPFIAALRNSYTLDEEGESQPMTYKELHDSFVPGTQRLVVFPLDAAPEVLTQAVEATNDILDHALPPGITVYVNDPSRLHMTVFYLSHVDDVRPEPHKKDGSRTPRPFTADNMHYEADILTEAMSTFTEFSVQIERVVLADSGTLLLCYSDPSGQMQALRERLWQTLPGAPTRQTTIVHSSMLRILSPSQLSDSERDHVQRLCALWTSRLKGKLVPCRNLWYINETTYANIVGDKTPISLKAPESCSS